MAFFGLLYYGALRPAEAAALGKGDLTLPGEGWGELYLPKSAPTTGAASQRGATVGNGVIGGDSSTGRVRRSG